MLFPIGDDNTDRQIKPYVNYIFIALNILVFVFLQGMGSDTEFTYSFSTVPEEILTGSDVVTEPQRVQDPVTGQQYTVPGLGETPISPYITLITSMFMHGGLAHIFGNLLYLFIFGDNIENYLGHLRYFLFYITVGIIASLAHVFTSAALDANLLIPSLGASGAISGVLGGYLLLFPKRKVTVIIFRIFTRVPAFVALGVWIVFQVVMGMGALGAEESSGGVAYAAHIGGFFAGLALVKVFGAGSKTKIK